MYSNNDIKKEFNSKGTEVYLKIIKVKYNEIMVIGLLQITHHY